MRYCAVSRCPSNNLTHKHKIGVPDFFFPRDPTYCQLWVKFCNRPKTFNPATHRVCIHHFTSDQFERDLKSELLNLNARPKLKATAVPMIKACDVIIDTPTPTPLFRETNEGEQSNIGSDILASISKNDPNGTLSLRKFSREYDNRKMKREITVLKQRISALERLNAAFREENKNLKRAIIDAEKMKQDEAIKQSQTKDKADVEDVLVLPGYTVILYK